MASKKTRAHDAAQRRPQRNGIHPSRPDHEKLDITDSVVELGLITTDLAGKIDHMECTSDRIRFVCAADRWSGMMVSCTFKVLPNGPNRGTPHGG